MDKAIYFDADGNFFNCDICGASIGPYQLDVAIAFMERGGPPQFQVCLERAIEEEIARECGK